jgi:hypothetical protein
MQQQLTGSSDRVTSSDNNSSSSNNIHHLSLGGVTQSVIKSAVKSSAAGLSPPAAATTASNVPLLSGQIVAQLNALLFSIHGLADKCIEAKVRARAGGLSFLKGQPHEILKFFFASSLPANSTLFALK